MKRALQGVLAVLSLIPLNFGLRGLIIGPKDIMPAEHVNAAIDNVMRYQSGYYLSLFMILWWIIPNIEKHTTLFRILVPAIFIGGLGRLASYLTIGSPPAQMIARHILELGAPAFAVWQGYVAKTRPNLSGIDLI